MLDLFNQFISSGQALRLTKALIIIVLGCILAKLISKAIAKVSDKYFEDVRVTTLRKIVFYLVLFLFAVAALSELGFNLSVILGATGILSVAIGFASQTSASNLVSGLFLIGERALTVGDMIRVGECAGYIISIDLLSIKIKTFDGLFVRIPNETMIKTQVTNLSKLPERRLDLKVGVAYKTDLNKVKEVLLQLAVDHPMILSEPEPLIFFDALGSSTIDVCYFVWTKNEDWFVARTEIYKRIKEVFDQNEIEIPFTQLTINTLSKNNPALFEPKN